MTREEFISNLIYVAEDGTGEGEAGQELKAHDAAQRQTIEQLEGRVKALEGALKGLVNEVTSYTSTVHYYGREQAAKDLDRREKLLKEKNEQAKAALAATGEEGQSK